MKDTDNKLEFEKIEKVIGNKDYMKGVYTIPMETLYGYLRNCWNQLYRPGCIFEAENLSGLLPACLMPETKQVQMYYPAYKIEIYGSNFSVVPEDDEGQINKLLEEIPYHTPVLHIIEKFMDGNIENNTVVMCQGYDLKQNEECRDGIISILEDSGYWVIETRTTCGRTIPVEFLEDKNYFRILEIN